ncbi:MAG: filamentous hemagglutinin N-terminal domain-containing protein, partial [Symploca sp. SIO2B6]|nr:filamentous hemagglutinin N-terminal domain-containing protein [Symploca sp. SIO2B6]
MLTIEALLSQGSFYVRTEQGTTNDSVGAKGYLMRRQQPTKQSYLWVSVLIGSLGVWSRFESTLLAQVIPDTTLPAPSVVNQANSIYEITAGTTSGNNLFHSFEAFSIPEGNTAFFNNSLAIDRIITRVTGENLSTIDGLIQANGNADLFLVNPKGIVFGANAQLDIGGSFIASTADRIEFDDGSIYSATPPSSSSLLTMSVPVGLQYGNTPGAITVNGSGNGLSFNADTFVIDRSQRPNGLQVNDGETLALMGAGVILEGANLTASGGRVDIGSVEGNQFIELVELASGWGFNYDTVTQFEDIRLSQAASIDVSGVRGGDSQVQGRTIQLSGGSSILASTLGDGTGGQLSVNASDRLIVTGFSTSTDGTPLLPSSIISGLETGATGTGGTTTIQAPILRVLDGGAIASNNLGSGSVGDLLITASDRIRVDGGIPDLEFSGGLLADVYSSGDGSNLSIETGRLSVTGGGEISALTLGQGNAGRLDITADTVNVEFGAPFLGASAILATVQPGASGNANDLTIVTDQLRVSDGATILASTFGDGNSGNLTISAQTIDVFGVSPGGNPGGLATGTQEGSGQGGELIINTERLLVSGGASISATTVDSVGNGGNLTISAQTIDLSGTASGSISSLLAETNNGGIGGNITINTNQLRLSDGAQISSTTSSDSNGGNISITAQDIELRGATNEL